MDRILSGVGCLPHLKPEKRLPEAPAGLGRRLAAGARRASSRVAFRDGRGRPGAAVRPGSRGDAPVGTGEDAEPVDDGPCAPPHESLSRIRPRTSNDRSTPINNPRLRNESDPHPPTSSSPDRRNPESWSWPWTAWGIVTILRDLPLRGGGRRRGDELKLHMGLRAGNRIMSRIRRARDRAADSRKPPASRHSP